MFCLGMVVGLGVAGTVSHMGGRVDFTLAFDSSPIKGEGEEVGLSCCYPTLWILP